ncbi:hypothetical protein G7Y79_00013g034420 [Physcia stellaris]|nr:hypothetical protein G7Y79_00013g034420 [Physcia stellaris]
MPFWRSAHGQATAAGEREKSGETTPSHVPIPVETLAVSREDGKLILPEEYCIGKLGFDFSTRRKWTILSIIFAVQVSMNFNASVYGNAIEGMQREFDLDGQLARVGQAVFLIAYGFGSELWAPWSEEIGRFPIMQASLLLVNLSQLLPALAPNYGVVIAGRLLGGLSSAGGSVTLGMIADMWGADSQQYALNFMVLSSCGGSALGPIFGAFIQKYLNWRWVFWVQMIAGPTVGHVLETWARPFVMFATEPIVLWLSLLSGFSDALIFIFIDSFHPVFQQWGFDTIQHGMTFIPIIVGYLVAYLTYLPILRKHELVRRRDPHRLSPESRLVWLTWTAPFLAAGLFGFAAATMGPPIPWIVPMIFVFFVAIANYNIYMGTVDYMVAAYGPLSASATGGNALARDVLAGVAAMYSDPFYHNIGTPKWQKFWPTIILGILALAFTVSVYVIYFNGPTIRARSKMAQDIRHDRDVVDTRRSTLVPDRATDIESAFRNRQVPPEATDTPTGEVESTDVNVGNETPQGNLRSRRHGCLEILRMSLR